MDQKDFLTTAGYSKLGIPGDMIPPIVDTVTGNTDFIDERLGLAFHSDSAMLKGILASASSVCHTAGYQWRGDCLSLR